MKVLSKSYWNSNNHDTTLISWLFLRGLALIYFSAFASMSVQIEGLVGANGMLPAVSRLEVFEQFYQQQKIYQLPTIFWLNASDLMLRSVCYAGMLAASLVLLNIFSRTGLISCYILYLSIVEIGQDFTHFQWDVFLLETGFLAILLTWHSGIIIFLFRWLLARFMFMGGVVKLASGDPSWANLTALNFHYQTQPLPSPIAYYAYQLPEWFHKICVGGVLFIELIIPFFVFLPRRFRLIACAAFILLQASIILTGNYTFFNLLTILLCIFLLQDKDIATLFPDSWVCNIQQKTPTAGSFAHITSGLWGIVVITVCICQIWLFHLKTPLIEPLNKLLTINANFSLINNYGPFAVMTTERNEIIVQGSDDGLTWSDYHFKYKPGALNRELGWNIPHQPRLDWQMWFEALKPNHNSRWFDSFLSKLLQGSPQVTALLDQNPFPEKPPKYIRAMIYRYAYTTPQHAEKTGQIWQRWQARSYSPVISLEPSFR